MVKVAQNFPLTVDDGSTTSLNAIIETSRHGIVVFTYPKANTPGCTKQACGFRDAYDEIRSHGFDIFGMSRDKPALQSSWRSKNNLQFPLICEAADFLQELGAKDGASTIRSVFIILKNGDLGLSKIKIAPLDSVEAALQFVVSYKAGHDEVDHHSEGDDNNDESDGDSAGHEELLDEKEGHGGVEDVDGSLGKDAVKKLGRPVPKRKQSKPTDTKSDAPSHEASEESKEDDDGHDEDEEDDEETDKDDDKNRGRPVPKRKPSKPAVDSKASGAKPAARSLRAKPEKVQPEEDEAPKRQARPKAAPKAKPPVAPKKGKDDSKDKKETEDVQKPSSSSSKRSASSRAVISSEAEKPSRSASVRKPAPAPVSGSHKAVDVEDPSSPVSSKAKPASKAKPKAKAAPKAAPKAPAQPSKAKAAEPTRKKRSASTPRSESVSESMPKASATKRQKATE